MAYSLLRATSRIFDIAVSGIGIAVFVGAIGGLFQQKSICSALSKEEQINRLNANDRILKRQKICYCVIIGILIILATVKFFGFLNFEDVFNGEYKYVGQTLNNKAEGYGKQFTNDGILMYDGEWVDGSESGSGEFVVYDSDGNIIKRYRGSFFNGEYNGEGILEFTDSSPYYYGKLIYHGRFSNGEVTEDGVYYYPDGTPLVDVKGYNEALKAKYPYIIDNIWNDNK